MRTKVIEPTNGSVMILNARPENGSSSELLRVISWSESTATPFMSGTSSGDGRKSTTASSIGCTPLFLKAEPHSTGTKAPLLVPLRISFLSVSTSGCLPSR
jgi:hypothetical protein